MNEVVGEIYFSEIQRFQSLVMWGLLVFLTAAMFYLSIRIAKLKRLVVAIVLSLATLVLLALDVICIISRMDTVIGANGILVVYKPFLSDSVFIPWTEVDSGYIRKYKPLREYGGWGVRNGKAGKAYNISGKDGLQLILKDGTKLLLGTHHPDQVEKAITTAKIKTEK